MTNQSGQSVNLYQPHLRPVHDPVSLYAATTVLGAVAMLLLVISLAMNYHLTRRQQELADLRRQEQKSSALLADLEKRFPVPQSNMQLQEDVGRLEQELLRVSRVMHLIDKAKRASSRGFTQFLEGLSFGKVAGVWLHGIGLLNGGSSIVLEGKVVAPNLVTSFINNLSQQKAFSGKTFRSFSLAAGQQREPREPLVFALKSSDQSALALRKDQENRKAKAQSSPEDAERAKLMEATQVSHSMRQPLDNMKQNLKKKE
ncbi:MAG: hypothetical protein HQL60_06275 [Magnetococcales bacterium]|nr:hypothetical protein [Magnetococcales bacterium]